VLKATPGSHPGVTFTSNALLTLAQQVLAAELNLAGGANPPSSVTVGILAKPVVDQGEDQLARDYTRPLQRRPLGGGTRCESERAETSTSAGELP
jgi:hypothetical protein